MPASPASLGKITRFLVLTVAAVGFLFDTYELLMFPVIGSDAVGELIKVHKDGTSPGWLAELGFSSDPDLKRGVAPTSVPVRAWGGRMLWIAALSGGIFGLLGGLLIDRLGRKTIMVASILAYSFSPVAAAFSTELWQLVLFRCTTFIGVCVEMVAAVTWLAELFEDKRTRELVIGWTLATASLGGILVTEAYNLIVEAAKNGHLPSLPFPEGHNPANIAWRFTLLTGLIPGAIDFVPHALRPRIRRLEEKETRGHVEARWFRRTFLPRVAADDDCDDDPVGVRLCGRIRRDSNDAAANRCRPSRHGRDDSGAGAGRRREIQVNEGRDAGKDRRAKGPGRAPRKPRSRSSRTRTRPSRSGAAISSAGKKSAASSAASSSRCCSCSCRAAG